MPTRTPARKRRWQLQEAKNKLSEVVRRAIEEGPQTITVRGRDTVVISAVHDKPAGKHATLWELLRPLKGLKVPAERRDARHREVDFDRAGG
ncbi:MAG: type II toxin-antitoxin system prevent-host-death family antitoxin [Planctomycetes bacterium]|nr:type II toxin-antitoxin system prevent-host-death family antitoxin [Planctomycetota bacterium]MCW8136927.1 type II toxin-antitoxin system prevent-host-death family antitoxin [Planctomycetota bacterium]